MNEFKKIGQYEIIQEIESGGISSTFLSKHPDSGENILIRTIKTDLDTGITDEDKTIALNQFKKTVQSVTSLNDPGLIRIYDFGFDNIRDVFFIVTSYLEDETLNEYTARKGGLSTNEALGILKSLTDLINNLHKNGIVHGELNPDNILLHPNGIILYNYGIPQELKNIPARLKDMDVDEILYLAPETISENTCDHQSDIYALGLIIYELLSDENPFESETLEDCIQSKTGQRPPFLSETNPEIPDQLARIVDRMIAVHPRHRSDSIYQLTEFLTIDTNAIQSKITFDFEAQDNEKDSLEEKFGEMQAEIKRLEEQLDQVTQRESESKKEFMKEFSKEQRRRQELEISFLNEKEKRENIEQYMDEMRQRFESKEEEIEYLEKLLDTESRRQSGLRKVNSTIMAFALIVVIFIVVWSALKLGFINRDFLSSDSTNQKPVSAEQTGTLDDITSQDSSEDDQSQPKVWETRSPIDIEPEPTQPKDAELIRTLAEHKDIVFSVAFSPDGQVLASGSQDATVKIWSLITGQVERTLNNLINILAFSPDGAALASPSAAYTIKVISTRTGEEIHTLSGHTNTIRQVTFSPDGSVLASASTDKTIRLWSLSTGQEILKLTGHNGVVRTVDFNSDGTILASGSYDNTIKLWSIANGREILTLRGHTGNVTSVSFSPDEKLLASSSEDKTIRLWSMETSDEIRTLSGHEDKVRAVIFRPDGKMLASAGYDDKVMLWSVEAGELLSTIDAHDEDIEDVAFSPDGKTLASCSDDKTIKLWDVSGIDTHG